MVIEDSSPDQARSAIAEARAMADAERWSEAFDLLCRALDLWWRFADGGRSAHLPELLFQLDGYAKSLIGTHERPAALRCCEQAVMWWQRLVDDGRTKYEPALAEALNAYALVLKGTGRPAEATAHSDRAVALFREVVDRHPAMRLGLGAALVTQVLLLADAGRWAETLDRSTEAVTLWQALADENPHQRPNLARALKQWVVALRANGRLADAADAVEQVLDVCPSLDRAERVETLRTMAGHTNAIMAALVETSGPASGVGPSELAVRIHRALAAEDSVSYGVQLAQVMARHFVTLVQAGREDEALAFHEAATRGSITSP